VYAREHIFAPLKMIHTEYLPIAGGLRRTGSIEKIAPTAYDDEGTAATNPDYDKLLRGVVHDPTTRRMGGVAGHAGVFSTAGDVALFGQALLDRLAGRPSDFPLEQATLQLMTRPEQPATAESGVTILLRMARRRRVWLLAGLGGTSIRRTRGLVGRYFLLGVLVIRVLRERVCGWIPIAILS
jgi:CubicO group peptidase (beta-lactamase class C family)